MGFETDPNSTHPGQTAPCGAHHAGSVYRRIRMARLDRALAVVTVYPGGT